MKPIIFLGDEASAAGFRLAGISTRVATAGHEETAFQQARGEAAVLLVDARCAARLPPSVLAAAQAAVQPLLLVLPASPEGLPPGDPAAQVRRLLGLAP